MIREYMDSLDYAYERMLAAKQIGFTILSTKAMDFELLLIHVQGKWIPMDLRADATPGPFVVEVNRLIEQQKAGFSLGNKPLLFLAPDSEAGHEKLNALEEEQRSYYFSLEASTFGLEK